jgi:hypothetical protein
MKFNIGWVNLKSSSGANGLRSKKSIDCMTWCIGRAFVTRDEHRSARARSDKSQATCALEFDRREASAMMCERFERSAGLIFLFTSTI